MNPQRAVAATRRACPFTLLLLAVAVAVGLGGASGVHAADATFPNRPIVLIVPNPPGGGSDIIARVVASFGPKYLSQPLEVQNIVGGENGALGTAKVAAARPDGYTLLLFGDDGITIEPILARVPYSYKSFIPIAQTDTIAITLVAGPRSPVKSATELKAYAQQHPNQLTVGVSDLGGSPQLAVASVLQALGNLQVRYIPFVGGSAALTAALGGTVPLMAASVATTLPSVQASKLVPLFVTSYDPVAQLPNVPGTKALGVPGASYLVRRMIFAPVNTPPDVVAKLNAAFGKILTDPEVKAKLFALGVTATPSTDIRELEKQLAAEVGMLRILIPTVLKR